VTLNTTGLSVAVEPSKLTYPVRCIAAFPPVADGTGFAYGGVEGRVHIAYMRGPAPFSFKCHRQDKNVFSVNDITYSNTTGAIATVGGDGMVQVALHQLTQAHCASGTKHPSADCP